MDLTRVDDLRTALKLAGIHPRKGLGQHFLIDRQSLELIIDSARPEGNDTVLEIGPGLGVMTQPLTQRVGKLVAVEADVVLAELLRRDAPSNLQVVEQDIMEFDFSSMPKGYKVIANIPYYLTSRLIRLLLENKNSPSVMSLLIQEEVAQRIVAKPGKMSILALSVQYYAEATYIQVVERHKFWPAPAVDSAIILIKMRDKPIFDADIPQLFRLVRAGFGEKRKQLKNSLAGGLNLSSELATSLLLDSNIPITARAQELSFDQWERLYRTCCDRDVFS
jgi:16S rRNA (adenine1518-N6/adenine1519-N6)-dimethyltransferase